MPRPTTRTTGDHSRPLGPRSLLGVVGVLTALFTLAASGCATLENLGLDIGRPTAQIEGLTLQDLTLDGATLGIDLGITNPYSVGLPLTDLDFVLASAGTTLLSGKAALDGMIPAGTTKTVATTASFRFADVLQALGGVQPGSVVPYDLNANLSTTAPGVGPISIPLRKQGEFPIPRVPEVELSRVEWGQISLDEASAVMRVRVRNMNSFPVELRKLSYDLSLGGRPIGQTSLREVAAFAEGGEQELSIPISFRPRDLGLAALNMLQGGGAQYGLDGIMEFQTPFGPLDLPYKSAGNTVFGR